MTPTPNVVQGFDANDLAGVAERIGQRRHRYFSWAIWVLDGMTRVDLEASLRWAIIGAENGDARSQWLLENRMAADDRARARFWLRRAADQGYQPAQKELAGERARGHVSEENRAQ
jgi:TPR repeat protein